jgi:serine/threonine protein kinase/Tol biopolymer transport system component
MSETIQQVQQAFTAYTIERELGAGGMATVYLAHDKRHGRKVAIKVLHAELAAVLGAERFLQEIRVTANLQHPHILGLIDSAIVAEGELQGRPYYVMPFIRGESLRERLNKEQQLPVSDAVRIATEIASALDYAHREGVVHRDIKPENILLHDGSAIVADFGIALAVTQAGGARMTQTGLSLGTPSYMSPEQAMGERTITARSDIYSLGAVTYEMLAGEPPFTGPTVQAIVARVMTEEPRPLTASRRNVPPHVAAAVARALEKIPADRFASAHEFSEALHNPSFTPAATSAPVARDRNSRRLLWALYGAGALLVLMTAGAIWGWMRPAPPKQVVRYALVFDSTEAMAASVWGRLDLSPDGSRVAYVGGPRSQLLIRSRNQLHASPIAGTERAINPFFSPDGQRVGFLSGGNLQLVSLNGGSRITVTDSLVGLAGASWGPDGFIYVDGRGDVGLVRVAAKAAAVPEWFTRLDTASGEFDHTSPDALPNGKGVLFTVAFRGKDAAGTGTSYAIAVADISSGTHRVLVRDAMYARYAPSGHLLYVMNNRTLMVVPFDQNSMKITGEPTVVTEGLSRGVVGSSDLAVSKTGTLMYATSTGERKRELVWVTRDGKVQSVDPAWAEDFRSPALSPDGKRLAVEIGLAEIWIKHLDRGPSIKLTVDERISLYPTWTPDGRSVTFFSNTGAAALWTKRADGSAAATLQLRERRNPFSPRWSPDGKWLVYQTRIGSSGSGDILGIRPGIDTAPVPLVATRFTEIAPAISPDGRWLAYSSNESGQDEIYVVPFPNTGAAKWAVSTHGGTEPLWSHGGGELFYRDPANTLMAVEVSTTPTFSAGRSAALFSAVGFVRFGGSPQYAVAPDDRRFLMIRPLATNAPYEQLIVVDNWFEELKAKARK